MSPTRTKARKQSSLLATRKITGITPVIFLVPWCAGQDSNLRRLMPSDLQSDAIDHSATDAKILCCTQEHN